MTPPAGPREVLDKGQGRTVLTTDDSRGSTHGELLTGTGSSAEGGGPRCVLQASYTSLFPVTGPELIPVGKSRKGRGLETTVTDTLRRRLWCGTGSYGGDG